MAFRWVQRIWTQSLMLAGQARYQLSHNTTQVVIHTQTLVVLGSQARLLAKPQCTHMQNRILMIHTQRNRWDNTKNGCRTNQLQATVATIDREELCMKTSGRSLCTNSLHPYMCFQRPREVKHFGQGNFSAISTSWPISVPWVVDKPPPTACICRHEDPVVRPGTILCNIIPGPRSQQPRCALLILSVETLQTTILKIKDLRAGDVAGSRALTWYAGVWLLTSSNYQKP